MVTLKVSVRISPAAPSGAALGTIVSDDGGADGVGESLEPSEHPTMSAPKLKLTAAIKFFIMTPF